MKYHIETINWNGIDIEVRWLPNTLGDGSRYKIAHLEVQSIFPAKAQLPITETGYRSLFTDPEEIEQRGGPIAYVKAWLAREARQPTWQQAEMERRQLTLF